MRSISNLLIETPWRLALSSLPFPQGFSKAHSPETERRHRGKPPGHFWEEIEMIRKVLFATLASLALTASAARA
jgi:hypothetical protein